MSTPVNLDDQASTPESSGNTTRGIGSKLGDGPIASTTVPFSGKVRLSGLHSSVVRAIGVLPLTGRRTMRNLIHQCHDANDSKSRWKAFGRLVGTMAAYTPIHLGAAGMGGLGIYFNVEELSQTHSFLPIFLKSLAIVVDTAYASANLAAVYAQTDISLRLAKDLWGRRDETPETARPIPDRPVRNFSDVDVYFTAGGNAAFGLANAFALDH